MKIDRTFKFWWQRRTRGWDDSETWNLDSELARWLVPRLRRFKELSNGTPIGYCEFDNDHRVTNEKDAGMYWHEDLDTMIRAFEWCADERSSLDPAPIYVEQGLELFKKRFFNLWW